VTVVCDPADYSRVIDEMKRLDGTVSQSSRFKLAEKTFFHTAKYDSAIAEYLFSIGKDEKTEVLNPYPQTLCLLFEKVQEMRYGENPHQSAAFYREQTAQRGAFADYTQLQGKELSFNNISDADVAWECVKTFDEPACVILKHANPCGIATGTDLLEAYESAFKTDPEAAFGGIIAFNRELDQKTAEKVARLFVEVLIAPAFSPGARAVFSDKKNVRLLEIPLGQHYNEYELKRVGGGLLLQSPDVISISLPDLQFVTQKEPTPRQIEDMLFAWKAVKFVKSNAIVFCRDNTTLAIGAGQMSRVDAARTAVMKAKNIGISLAGTAVASDAFLPFRDGLDMVADAGATSLIQPGGSIRDREVIDAANERGIVMAFTSIRHFRH
jgi:phosphoribosylaminoimidazolecarboxamide formyltransferase/IMP cyclohydrolase